MRSEELSEQGATEWILRSMKKVEYVVSDDPIMGKVVVTHYVDEPRCNRDLRDSKNRRKYGKCRAVA